MGSNLPPGVSVSDLPGNRQPDPPQCYQCGSYACMEALGDGYPLCEEHDTEEGREAYEGWEAKRQREEEALARMEEELKAAKEIEAEYGSFENYLIETGQIEEDDLIPPGAEELEGGGDQ